MPFPGVPQVSAIAMKPLILVVLCGLAYAADTVAMKAATEGFSPAVYALIDVLLGGAVLAEVAVLSRMELGAAYIAIIATESLVVVAAAALIGEGLGPRELLGAGLVLAGTVMIGA